MQKQGGRQERADRYSGWPHADPGLSITCQKASLDGFLDKQTKRIKANQHSAQVKPKALEWD